MSFKGLFEHLCIIQCKFSGHQSLTIRLTDRINNSTGFLEVFDGVSSWGSICAQRWDLVNADLACQYLGFSSAKSTLVKPASRDTVGYITGTSCLSSRTPDGIISSFEKCVFNAWNKPYYRSCTNYGIAGVVCSGRPTCLEFNQTLYIVQASSMSSKL